MRKLSAIIILLNLLPFTCFYTVSLFCVMFIVLFFAFLKHFARFVYLTYLPNNAPTDLTSIDELGRRIYEEKELWIIAINSLDFRCLRALALITVNV